MNIHHRTLSGATGAVAAAASIFSSLVGVLAMFTAPHGFRRFAIALHLAHEPLVVRVAPFVAAFAVMAAAGAGLVRLYSWRRELLNAHGAPPPSQNHQCEACVSRVVPDGIQRLSR
jgi:hypothetical protein